MIDYTTADTENDLGGILRLQKSNLPVNLSDDEIRSQGFVTVIHSYADLLKLNNIEPHIIAKDNGQVIAYLLAMTKQSGHDIPVLIPMFMIFEEVIFGGKMISDYNYMVVGQVCVDKQYRGQGILDKCYWRYREQFKGKYDFAITEIAATNPRSLNAHKRIGFTEIHRYSTPDDVEWSVVIWDWEELPQYP